MSLPIFQRTARKRLLLMAFGLLAAAATQAQSAGEPPAGLPTQLHYQSVLADEPVAKDPPPQDWRTVNNRVGQIGGWRAYAKEIMTGIPADATLGSKAPPSASAPTKMDMKGHAQ